MIHHFPEDAETLVFLHFSVQSNSKSEITLLEADCKTTWQAKLRTGSVTTAEGLSLESFSNKPPPRIIAPDARSSLSTRSTDAGRTQFAITLLNIEPKPHTHKLTTFILLFI
jgi:hypothetical protein